MKAVIKKLLNRYMEASEKNYVWMTGSPWISIKKSSK